MTGEQMVLPGRRAWPGGHGKVGLRLGPLVSGVTLPGTPGAPGVVMPPGVPSVLPPGVPSVLLPGRPGVVLPGTLGVVLPGRPGVVLPGVPGVVLPGMPGVVVVAPGV
jgi:hypothetical protein